MKTGKLFVMLVVLAVAACSGCAKMDTGGLLKKKPQSAVPEKLSIRTYMSGKETISVEKSGDTWKASKQGAEYSVKKSGDSYTLLKGTEEVASGSQGADKLKLKAADGSPYMEMKFKDDKIKVTLKDGEDPWEIKFKEDKIKVVRTEIEYGKVKFNPESKKAKAKNAKEEEIADIPDTNAMTAALAPFLIPDIDEERQMFLALLLMSMGK